jgi:hypothetical protein
MVCHLHLCVVFVIMIFVWVYVSGFLLGIWFSFELIAVVWVYICVFPWGLYYCSGFRVFMYTVIWTRGDVLSTKGQGGVVAGKYISHHHGQTASQRSELR